MNLAPETMAMNETQGPGITEYLGVFKRRIILILIPALLGFSIAAALCYVLPRRYSAKTRFKVLDPGTLQKAIGSRQSIVPHKPVLETIAVDIKTRKFLEPIVAEVGFTEGFNLSDPAEQHRYFQSLFDGLVIEAPISESGTDVVSIACTGRNQARLVNFIHEVRERYFEKFRAEYRQSAREFYENSRRNRDEKERTLENLKASYDAFKADPDYALVGIFETRNRALIDLAADNRRVSQEIESHEAELETIDLQIQKQNKNSIVRNTIPNPKRARVKEALEAKNALLNEFILKRQFTDRHPDVMEVKKEIDELKTLYQSLPAEVDGGASLQQNDIFTNLIGERNKIERDLQAAYQRRDHLQKSEARAKKEIRRTREVTSRDTEFKLGLDRASNQLKTAQLNYDGVKGAWDRVKGKGADLFDIIEYPNGNTPPIFPTIPLFLVVGLAAGLLMGFGLAFLKEFGSMAYMSSEQLQHRVALPVLGELGKVTTPADREESRSRRNRWLLAGIVVFGLITIVHVCYFSASLNGLLPIRVVDILDVLYAGK